MRKRSPSARLIRPLTDERQGRPLRSTPARVLGVCLWCAAFLVAGTLAAHWLYVPPVERVDTEADLWLGWRYPRNAHITRGGWNPDIPERSFWTNSRGMKSERDYPAPRTEGDVRVMCLGDSITNLEAQENWPERLQPLLEQALPGRDVWVLNAAMVGSSTNQVRLIAEIEVPLFEPDYVIALPGVVDNMLARDPRDDPRALPPISLLITVMGQRWPLIQWAKEIVPEASLQRFAAPLPVPGNAPTVPIDLAEENLRDIVETAEDAGAVPVLMTGPWLNTENPGEIGFNPIEPYWEMIREVGREEPTLLADVAPLFDRDDRGAFFLYREHHGYDTIVPLLDNFHLNTAGSDLMAVAVARVLLGDIADRHPDWEINMAPVDAMLERLEETPQPTGDPFDGIAPPECVTAEGLRNLREILLRIIAGENPFEEE